MTTLVHGFLLEIFFHSDTNLKMKKFEIILQLIMFGIFLYQMQNSVHKYITAPVIQDKSTVNLVDIKQPAIFVCSDENFDFHKAKAYGYQSYSDFVVGKLADSSISWKGINRDQQFKDLMQDILKNNFSDFKSERSEAANIFLLNQGYCMEVGLTNLSHIEEMFYNKRSSVAFLVDPSFLNSLLIFKMSKEKMKFGPTKDEMFSLSFYELSFKLYDASIHDGVFCTDYDKIHSSYGKCVVDVLKAKLLDHFGCLPPWVPDNHGLICEDDKEVIKQPNHISKILQDDLFEILVGRKMKMIEDCLPPCQTLDVVIEQTYYLPNLPEHAKINLKAKENVDVYHDIYAYDEFSLVVDLGSALGLWLGLSVLSIVHGIAHLAKNVSYK